MHMLDALRIFQRVAELKSFVQAAATLDLPRATVSTAVASLERELGTRLLQRTTRRVELTTDGQACLARAADLVADFDTLGSMFRSDGAPLAGRVRIDLPIWLARNLVPRLPALLAAHPLLRIELSSTDRRVDLVSEGFDCVVRVGTLADSSLVAKPLGALRIHNLASADYIARCGLPQSLEDLARHQLVHYTSSFGSPLADAGFEYVDPVDGRLRFVPMAGALTVNNSDAYRAACLAGLGIIQSPLTGVRELLASGMLVEVLPQWQAEAMPVSLLVAHRRQLPARVQRMMQWLEAEVRAMLA